MTAMPSAAAGGGAGGAAGAGTEASLERGQTRRTLGAGSRNHATVIVAAAVMMVMGAATGTRVKTAGAGRKAGSS